MTPAALHRMFPLALAVGLDAYVVASVVLENHALAAVLAIALVAVFAFLWLVLPRREHRRQE